MVNGLVRGFKVDGNARALASGCMASITDLVAADAEAALTEAGLLAIWVDSANGSPVGDKRAATR